jgi:two-component system, NtrC family, nitrogen regulation sensor histidine kinase NtrY
VIGHELNNSLAPIKSIAASLEAILDAAPRADDWEDDVRRGLTIVGSRAEALSRFMQAYARLAKLPPPAKQPVEIGQFVRRAAALETRLPVELVPGAASTVAADPDQLEQALINLVKNAVDASLETGGGVRVGWRSSGAEVEVKVEDDGPGLANTANLFVPFFTTKPGGSGIGLAITRQIVEGHGGTLSLENRPGGHGCVARLRLPRSG